ncbi:MAG: lactonase family protein [Cyclobacteriaceae bacterium]
MNVTGWIFFVYLVSMVSTFAQQSSKEIIYLGTYSERGSEGIYVMNLDRGSGTLTPLQTVPHKNSPTFLEVHPSGRYLYAVYREGMDEDDKNGTVTAFEIDQQSGKLSLLNEQSSLGAGPCHISLAPDGKFAFVSNYAGGSLAVYPVNADGSLGKAADFVQHKGKGAHEQRQTAPHMHSVIPSENGRFIYASDLGIDKIMIYEVNPQSGRLSAAATPYVASQAGAGPRHFALHPHQDYAFSIEELSSTITSYKVDKAAGALSPLQSVSALPEQVKLENNTTADIHVSPDGKFVYGSNRGHDSIVIYAFDPESGKMTYVGHEASGGGHPRNFCIDQKGEFIFVANRDDDNVVSFRRNKASGRLTRLDEVRVPAAVCVRQLVLP